MGVINFPEVPQTLKVFSKVTPGTRFMFTGRCDTKNFSFALISKTEIAIYLEFGMEDENKLIKARAFSNGKWSNEVLLKNPILPKTDFFIQIVAKRSEFEIFSGGSYLFSMKHFIPMDIITGIRLMETMTLYRAEMEQL